MGLADFIFLNNIEKLPDLKDIWWIVLVVPFTCGTVVTLGCGGASLGKRIVTAAICGIFMGFIYTIISAILAHNNSIVPDNIFVRCVWRVFIFAILSTIGAVVTELMLSDPDLKN